jgi:hypothetical protein
MSHQGYLIVHERSSLNNGSRTGSNNNNTTLKKKKVPTEPRIAFFQLEDGYLRYYMTSHCTRCLGEIKLSGCKLTVKAQKREDDIPFSFYVEARKVFVKDRSYTLGTPSRLELSASTNDIRQEWGKALFSWQRYYWRDPISSSIKSREELMEDKTIRHQLEEILIQYEQDKQARKEAEQKNQQNASGVIQRLLPPVLKKTLAFYTTAGFPSLTRTSRSISNTSSTTTAHDSEEDSSTHATTFDGTTSHNTATIKQKQERQEDNQQQHHQINVIATNVTSEKNKMKKQVAAFSQSKLIQSTNALAPPKSMQILASNQEEEEEEEVEIEHHNHEPQYA